MLFVKLGAVVLGSFLAKIAATWCLSAALEDIQSSWKLALFEAQLNRDMQHYDASSSSAETISRVSSEVREIKSTLRRVITTGITAAAQTAGGLASLFMISPQLTTGLGAVLIPAVWLANTLGSSLRSQSSKSHAAVAEADSHAAEALSSIRTVRACTAEEEELQRYEAKVGRAAEHSLWLSRGVGMFDAAMGLGVYSIVAGLLAAGASLVGTGDLQAADLAGYMLQAVRLQGSLGALSMTASKLNQASGSASKVVEVLEDTPTVNAKGGVKWKPLRGDITFKDVHFTYPSRPDDPVLKGMSFSIPSGKTVALVGTSGAGKSTILSLLERFYAADEGSILIDGREISHIDARWLRSRTAVVPQSPTLFGGLTIDENVRYGNPAASANDVTAALASADCQFVESLPKGRHTLVGERGVSLSGGQRQRLAIARALLREPSILCLDEYTSALDAHTEENLASSIASLAHSKTCIIIAHRLATVKSSDLILVLQHGKVVEQGSHVQLVQDAGPYADMVKKQLL